MERNYPLSFLKAKTPEELREVMKAHFLLHGKKYHYTAPSFAQGSWYTWFELSVKEEAEQDRKG